MQKTITILEKGTNAQYYRVYVRYTDNTEGWLYTNNHIYYPLRVGTTYLATIIDLYITGIA